MDDCKECKSMSYAIMRLERRIRELEDENRQERRKNEDFHSVKRERDEMRKSLDRSYDNYVTDPERHSARENSGQGEK